MMLFHIFCFRLVQAALPAFRPSYQKREGRLQAASKTQKGHIQEVTPALLLSRAFSLEAGCFLSEFPCFHSLKKKAPTEVTGIR